MPKQVFNYAPGDSKKSGQGYTLRRRRLATSKAKATRKLIVVRAAKENCRNAVPLAYLSATDHNELCSYTLFHHGTNDPLKSETG